MRNVGMGEAGANDFEVRRAIVSEQIELVLVQGNGGYIVGHIADFFPGRIRLAYCIDGSLIDCHFIEHAVGKIAECPARIDGGENEWQIGWDDFRSGRKSESEGRQ